MTKRTGIAAVLAAGILLGSLGSAQAAQRHHAKRHHSSRSASTTHASQKKQPYDQPQGVANLNAGTSSTGTSGVGTDTSATGATQSPVSVKRHGAH